MGRIWKDIKLIWHSLWLLLELATSLLDDFSLTYSMILMALPALVTKKTYDENADSICHLAVLFYRSL